MRETQSNRRPGPLTESAQSPNSALQHPTLQIRDLLLCSMLPRGGCGRRSWQNGGELYDDKVLIRRGARARILDFANLAFYHCRPGSNNCLRTGTNIQAI